MIPYTIPYKNVTPLYTHADFHEQHLYGGAIQISIYPIRHKENRFINQCIYMKNYNFLVNLYINLLGG